MKRFEGLRKGRFTSKSVNTLIVAPCAHPLSASFFSLTNNPHHQKPLTPQHIPSYTQLYENTKTHNQLLAGSYRRPRFRFMQRNLRRRR
jgi:hypothetical protein